MKKKRGPPVRNLRITVEYDGSRYFGWQVQQGKPTVQGELERALREICGRPVTVIGAGRTDAGAHALGQVANFRTTSRIPAARWPAALNAHVPEDIRVHRAEEVSLEFHAQFNAKRKTYRYTVVNRPTGTALERRAAHVVRRPLDEAAMARAAALLAGRNDFRAFGSEMSRKENTVRSLDRTDVRREGDHVLFTFTSDGFLYNQVRAMVGTLLEVGMGKRPPEWVREILESKDRRNAGANVPAKGLVLVSVEY